jgi:hypothetical protein
VLRLHHLVARLKHAKISVLRAETRSALQRSQGGMASGLSGRGLGSGRFLPKNLRSAAGGGVEQAANRKDVSD